MKLKSLIKKLRAAGFSVGVELDADDSNVWLIATQPKHNADRYPHQMRLGLTGGSWWGNQDELSLRIREFDERVARLNANAA